MGKSNESNPIVRHHRIRIRKYAMTQKTTEIVALVGATGAIGKSVAAALHQKGQPYRAIGRSRTTLETTFGDNPLAELAVWDPDDEASIRKALRGVAVVVYMVGVPYTDFHLHPILMRRVLDAAIAEKVDRLLLVGTLYVFGRAQSTRVTENHPKAPHTFKGRKRKEQEELVLAAHTTGEIRTTVLRLPDFYGPGIERSLLSDLFAAVKQNRKAKLIGPIDRPHEFVFVPDVGPVVVKLLDTPSALGETWNLGGAGVTSQLQLARLAYGKPPRCVVAGKMMLRLLGLFDPFLREFVEMHYLLTDPLIVDDSALQRLLGPITKTPYSEGVRQSLAVAE
ncbi:NAD-dependent epimerase/dehydratase family protein [Azotobacter chroococcum NCIMB 8003]|uniref:NAD-dependent epimerase/dehydratase family protein n=2 Tax=Azotobacter chroococcum TaxID=353 RepID=A0A0C4WT10_9GAMM|nr:NAD-dependent epimerase/dehydratase family protein [Azotobacter chroococcum NCIMB 8003]